MRANSQNHKVDRRAFLDGVIARGGMRDWHEGRRAIAAVLPVLSRQLTSHLRARVTGHLIEPWSQMFKGPEEREALSVDGFVQRVAQREGVPPGFGLEHAQAVCQALIECLPTNLRRDLRDGMPREVWDRICQPAKRDGAGPRTTGQGRPASNGTLASGRAGSQRPLSEARPAQSGSILMAEDPHGATKISSAPGPIGSRDRKTTGQ